MTVLYRYFAMLLAVTIAFPAFALDRSPVDDTTLREAEAFELTLQTTWPAKGKDAKAWRAEGEKVQEKDPKAATGFFASSVVLDKANAETWLLLARAYLAIETEKYGEKNSYAKNAGFSAALAFQRTKAPAKKANALAVYAESLGNRDQWKPALAAYKASLAIKADAEVQKAYDAMFDEHGFRMLDYTADNESASPRVCVQFSEPLAKRRIDVSDFVTLNGSKTASVRVNGNQICIEDLQHGKRYDAKIRSGLPSTEDNLTLKPVELAVYIRDRKPSVRFTSRNYVLPRTGQQGIPVVSTNTALVKATIYRIGDRRLAAEVLDGDFAKPLEPYQFTQIATQKGEKLWTGTMPVASKLNDEVTTAFPIDTLLPDLKPGLYVMTASPGEEKTADAATDGEEGGYEAKATQWFVVSDLGLTAFSGQDGVTVSVRSLATALPIADTEVRLVARNNEVLSTVKSDADGIAKFDVGVTRGAGGLAPALVVARGGDTDYGFLDLTKQAFDLSDRGVAGRNAPEPIDAFVFTERGVYRPGEAVYVTALLRDAASNAIERTPLILKLFRPDGVEDRRETLPDQGAGGRGWKIPLPVTAMTGTWRIAASVDPKAAALHERTFLIEDYVPERLEMKLSAATPSMSAAKPGQVGVSSRFLYGAPASNLGIEGEVTISAIDSVEAFPGYRIGQEDEKFSTVRKDLEAVPNTDASGNAAVSIPLPDVPQTSRPLEAAVTIRLKEPGGRALADRIALKVNTGKPYIGVKLLFDGTVPDGAPAAFDVIGIGADGKQAVLSGLKWEVQQIETRFQWYNKGGRWSSEPVNYENRVGGGVIDTKADAPVRIEAPVKSGRYRLDVISATAQGPATSVSFSAGFYVSEASDTPEILDLALDRASYTAGDDITVKIMPRMAGQATVAIVSDRILAMKTVAVSESGGEASFRIDSAWSPGAYATAILYKPMESAAKRMPSRAVGVKWIPLDMKTRELSVALETPPAVRPNGPVLVSASVAGLDPGEKAMLVLSGVDVGILNITRYKTPAPSAYFLGQRRLGLEMRDLYGKLIDGMQGVRGAIRSGGDGGIETAGRPSAEVPLAVHSGLIEVGADGKAQATFTLPPFNGTMRIAAQVWTAKKTGHGEKDVIVRDTVVAQATPPKFLTLGDEAEMHLSIENVEAPDGTYKIEASGDGALQVDKSALDIPLALERGKRMDAKIRIKGQSIGEGHLAFALTGPGDTRIERTFPIDVGSPAPNVRRRTTQVLAAAGAPLKVGAGDIGGLVAPSARVAITASRTAAFDVPGLLLALDRYPYGCAEQITSRAMPLLYYNDVAAKVRIGKDANAKASIEWALSRLYEMQSSSGSFGLWGPGSEDAWLTAYVTDFLVRARENGFAVRASVLDVALDRLKNTVANAQEFEKGGEPIAYALYVLSRAGRGVLGDLRYYADTKIDKFASPIARAQLGAGLAMLGDRERADRAFASAAALIAAPAKQVPLADRSDFGTELRDAAGVLALMGETGAGAASLPSALTAVTVLRAKQKDTTTQESLWLLLAARNLATHNNDLAFDVNGVRAAGPIQAVLSDQDVTAGYAVQNAGAEAVPVSVLVTGQGTTPEAAAESGFKIERKTYTPDGAEIAFVKIRQNQRVVVVLKATEIEPKRGEIVVEDRLPAGFDIENPALLKGTDLKAFAWLPSAYTPSFTSFRDDRFIAAYSLSESGRKAGAQLTMAYVMRAVNPGTYTHAGARVEDMYRPDRFARTAGAKVEVVAAR